MERWIGDRLCITFRDILWWGNINFGIWSCILYLRACIGNSRMGIYESKNERTMKQVLKMVMLLSREGKIRSKFWELSVHESCDFSSSPI